MYYEQQLESIQIGLSPEQRLADGEVLLAREMLDREEIEQLASQLINQQYLIHNKKLPGEQKENAVTALFERITAAGHLSEVSFTGDQQEIHLATMSRLLNGIRHDAPDWEKARRFQEVCEELTVYAVFCRVEQGELSEDTLVVTVSDYPDEFVPEQEKHKQGYRTLNRKGMLRSYHFEKNQDGSWTRILEQLSRSNSTDFSTRMWFNQHAAAVPLCSTGALAEQLVVNRSRLPDGVVSLMCELDGAFGESRKYGESDVLHSAHELRVDYNEVRYVSRAWREQLDFFSNEIEETENYLQVLRDGGVIDYNEHLFYFDQKIKSIIQRLLLLAPEFAKDTYGENAVEDVYQASMAFARGDYLEAEHRLAEADSKKDSMASTGCGGAGKVSDSKPQDSSAFKDAVEKAQDDKKNWKWKTGICVVKTCSTRPGKTKVGPCSICTKCQHAFDNGRDPTREKSVNKKEESKPAEITPATLAMKGIEHAKTANKQLSYANE